MKCWARRVLPTPGGPEIATCRVAPARTTPRRSSRRRTSSSRPMKGCSPRLVRASNGDTGSARPTIGQQATGPSKPLARTWRRPPVWKQWRSGPRVSSLTRISSRPASAANRAAMLGTMPSNSRRPMTTSPSCTSTMPAWMPLCRRKPGGRPATTGVFGGRGNAVAARCNCSAASTARRPSPSRACGKPKTASMPSPWMRTTVPPCWAITDSQSRRNAPSRSA